MSSRDADRTGYVAEFLRAAWGGVNGMFTRPTCRVEFRYRRRVWPSSHPPLLRAQLYTTALEEELNTRATADDGAGVVEI